MSTLQNTMKAATCAHGVDDRWKQQAACRGKSNNPNSPFYNAWYTDPTATHVLHDGTKISGEKLIQAALAFCSICPVQWDCASWAVDVKEPYCMWGARMEDTEWFHKNRRTPLVDIERARRTNTPIQVMIRQFKTERYS